MLLDVVDLHGGLLLPVSLAKIAAGVFHVRRPNLRFLIGLNHKVVVAVALDLAFDDLSVPQQEDAGGIGKLECRRLVPRGLRRQWPGKYPGVERFF